MLRMGTNGAMGRGTGVVRRGKLHQVRRALGALLISFELLRI